MELRYISRQYVSVWMVETQLKSRRPFQDTPGGDADPTFLYQPRPWRNPEGEMNLRFLNQLLHTLMTYMVKRPGMTLQDLVDKFNPDLLPTTCIELLQILVDLECVTMKILKPVRRKTIFGQANRRPVEETQWVREGHRMVDLDVTSSLRFAYFVGYMQSHPSWTLDEEQPVPGNADGQGGGQGGDDDDGQNNDMDVDVDASVESIDDKDNSGDVITVN